MDALKRSNFYYAIILAFFLSSCSIENEEEYSNTDLIHYLLNQQRYEEAIAVIQEIFPNSSDQQHLRLLWASALSGSAGLDMIDRFQVFENEFFGQASDSNLKQDDPNEDKQGFFQSPDSSELIEKNLFQDFETELLEGLMRGEETLRLLKIIPYFNREKTAVLQEAIGVLEGVGMDDVYSDAARVYESILDITLFITHLRRAFPYAELSGGSLLGEVSCRIAIRKSISDLLQSTYYLNRFFQALSIVERRSDSFNFNSLEEFRATLGRLEKYKNENVQGLLTADMVQRMGRFFKCQKS